MNLLLWSLKFCWAQDRWKPCSNLTERLSGMTCIQSREQENTPGPGASSLLTSIKYKSSSGLTLSGPVKHGKDVKKRWANFLELFQKFWKYEQYLNIWPFISRSALPDNMLSSFPPQRAGDYMFHSTSIFLLSANSRWHFSEIKTRYHFLTLSFLAPTKKYHILTMWNTEAGERPTWRGNIPSTGRRQEAKHWAQGVWWVLACSGMEQCAGIWSQGAGWAPRGISRWQKF